MPLAVQPGTTDLIMPAGILGVTDPYTVHTHYFGFTVPEAELGCFIYLRWQPGLGLSQGGVSIFRGLDNLTPARRRAPRLPGHDALADVDGGRSAWRTGSRSTSSSPATDRVRYRSPDGG